MTTTLVTGINGFTGRYLAPRLLDAGHNVHGIVRASNHADDGTTMHVCDLLDRQRLGELVAEIHPDYVIHLVAIAFVGHGDLEEMYRTNIMGTRALLEACANAAVPPRAVLICSSANVYGNANCVVLTEDSPIRPANDYAVTKAAVEHLAAIYKARLPIIVTRPFNYTGVGQSETFLIPKIVSHVRRRAATIELGELDVARDLSAVRTVVDAFLRLLETPAAIGRTFNVCSGKAVSLELVIALASEIAGYQIDVTVNPAFMRANEVKILQGSCAALENVIGPLDMPPFAETLRWMIEA